MKVFLTIWILAVLIQEVIPSTLVRLPRHAEKNLSLVHTEYEAKYEQKGKHGNESFSSVSGKQEIVHDNCAENWNSFAEKCASLIKDLVASLANAVSSKPGDATNLQLHIKNTFKHFDNTHNCTCLNHTGKTLSDLNLSPLFKNITINTVGPSTKIDDKNGSGATQKKCGGKGQPCDGDNAFATIDGKNKLLESPVSNGVGGDKNEFDQEQLKENGQPHDESCDEQHDTPQTEKVEEEKQQNRALVDAEDLDMNPENAEGSSDQSTNNSRRQIKYPQNLMKPQKLPKSSGDSNYNTLADDLKHSSSNPKPPESVRYPFLVTPRPNPQLAKPFESPAVALNPPSLSGPSLESDFPNSSEYEPSHVLLSQEHSTASTAVPPRSSSVKSHPSSASYLLTSPNNGNSSPNNDYLSTDPRVVTKPHSFFNNEKDPKGEVLSSNDPGSYQKPLSSSMDLMPHTNTQSPVIISKEPSTKDYNSEPAILVPSKLTGSEMNPQLKQTLPEKPIIDTQALNPILAPVEQLESDHKLVPLVMQPEKQISNSESSGQTIGTLPESPLLTESSNAELALPEKPVDNKPNTPSSVILPEESITGNHVLKPVPAEQVECGPDAILSPTTKSSQQPIVILPENEGITSDLSKIVPDNYKSNINSPAIIPAVSIESEKSVSYPGEFSLPKTIKSELPELIPENSAPETAGNFESPLLIQNKKPTDEPLKEWLPFTTPKTYDLDKTSNQGNTDPAVIINVPEEDQEPIKELPSAIPVINSPKNFPKSSEPESCAVTLNPSPIYEPSPIGSSSNPIPGAAAPGKNPAILSPEDILPIAANGQPLGEDPSTMKSPVYKLSPVGSSSNPIPGAAAPGKNPAILSPEDILPIAANGQPLGEDPSTMKSPIYKPSPIGSSSNPIPGAAAPGKNPAILSPEDILPIPANGQPLGEDPSTMKSPIYKPSPIGSSSNPIPGAAAPGKNPAILSPEDILPIPANEQLLFEEQATTECDQTTGDNLDYTISMTKPISSVPKVANQQLGISSTIEKQLSDKSNQLIAPDSQISGQPGPAVSESTLPQNSFSGAQYLDPETVSIPKEKLQYSQQSIQEGMFTTPLPFYPIKTVVGIPAISEQLHPQPVVVVKDPEVQELQGKDFVVTETPTASNIPGGSVIKDQQIQPYTVVVKDTSLNAEQVNTPAIAPQIAATTPVIIYPAKSLPISLQSSEQSYPESSHPVSVNTGSSDNNQKSEMQTVLFTTPVPIYPVKSIQGVPMNVEQQNSNAEGPLQPTATNESFLTSDSPNGEYPSQEHPTTSAPVKESDNTQYSQVLGKPDEIPAQLPPANFDDHLQSTTDLNPVPLPPSDSENNPVISSEPKLETVVPLIPLKPAQSGVLIKSTEAQPHQEEQNPLLIQPTTFQTTSEDPTPSQVNVPGLLTRTTSVPQDSDETMPIRPSTSPKTTSIYEHDDDDDEDCCSCESCTEEEITDPRQYKETACKNLEEARKELKAIFDKIKKKLKCGRKAPQTITSS